MKQLSVLAICVVIFLLTGPITQVAASTSAQSADVFLANGQGNYTIPSGYSAFAFRWAKTADLKYSWDNLNYKVPAIADDETEAKNDSYYYSDLITPQSGVLYIRSASLTQVKVNLIPKITPPVTAAIGNSNPTPGEVNLESGANYSALFIMNRAAWGANESYSDWDPAYWQANEIIVHHTVIEGNNSDYSQAVRNIYYYHAVTLGWGDIGYNYLIDPNGVIYEGRKGGEAVIGAHTYSYNAGSIGIAMIGDFTNATPTAAALQSLQNLMVERALLNGFSLQWGTTVTGHRDHLNNNTECPGNALYAALPDFVVTAEQARQAQVGGTIDSARTAMETALSGYLDVRLQLTFSTPGLTPEQKTQLIPKHSGIKHILSFDGDTAVIEIESWSYYGVWKDDTYDRVKMLYLIFSLDPNFSSVDLLPGFVYLGSVPDNTKVLLLGGQPKLLFSQKVVAGTGAIEIRKASDASLVESLDVNSAQVSFSDRVVDLSPTSTLQQGVAYYVTVCATCVKDTSSNSYAGFTTSDIFQFRKAFRIKSQSNYDGDNTADITIFDPPTAMWYIQRSSDSYYADPYIRAFGWSSVTPLGAGDYDGDGKTDIAIFDPDSAHWYIQKSSQPANSAPYYRAFGWKGVISIPSGDYDGDGKTDMAIFDPQSAHWYIQLSSKPADADPYIRAFGWNGVIPVGGGDYDGDGKTDIAIFDPATARWYIQLSSQPANAAPYIRAFGWKGVTPIMGGDYDGDGKTDIAIYFQDTGVWYIQLSSLAANSSPMMRMLGGKGQIALTRGDYDKDGMTDIGVYDSANAEWTLLHSTANFSGDTYMRKYGWSRVIPLSQN